MPPRAEKEILPFPAPRHLVPVATHFRSTWLVATLHLLRERGYYDAYIEHLAPQHRQLITESIAAVWIPIDVAIAHYEALDAVRIPADQATAIGRLATARVQETVIGTLVKLVTNVGATPWLIFPHFQRLWARIFRGSAVAVYELGPKEARIELAGWPCAFSSYVHYSLVGVVCGITELFCQRAFARELPGYRGRLTLAFRASWV